MKKWKSENNFFFHGHFRRKIPGKTWKEDWYNLDGWEKGQISEDNKGGVAAEKERWKESVESHLTPSTDTSHTWPAPKRAFNIFLKMGNSRSN